MATHGWTGNILRVNLTSGHIGNETLSGEFVRKYIGASGFNSYRLFELVSPAVDALSPENVLLFGVGPLGGTLAPGSSRTTVTAKSPLTDIFGDASIGGAFGSELKFAGYDQIIISGKASKPVYLFIHDNRVEIRDATHLWGKSTWDTGQDIREELRDLNVKVICIGPAGENLVRFANIIQPTTSAAGRAGMGAVMGSKSLKAIAVRGSGDVQVTNPAAFARASKAMREYVIQYGTNYKVDKETGSPGLMDLYHDRGILGVRNYQQTQLNDLEAVSGKTFLREYGIAHRACPSCFIACSHFHSVSAGEYQGLYGQGPEFGMTEVGALCDISNMPGILKMHQLFNLYGIDCVSGQTMLSWAMECRQRGILKDADFDGTPLSFGDYHSCVEMIPKMARREGLGDILAEGPKRAPGMIGRGSEKFMHHVKGQSLIVIDPRGDKQIGVQYLTSTRGADHLKALNRTMAMIRETPAGEKLWRDPDILDRGNPKGKGLMVKSCEDMAAVANAAGMCLRTCGSIQLLADLLSSATGMDFTWQELLEAGERIVNVQKAFNSRQGLTRKDDDFSTVMFREEAVKDGPRKGSVFERDPMLDEYYRSRDWDENTGLQTLNKLNELGLEEIALELKRTGVLP